MVDIRAVSNGPVVSPPPVISMSERPHVPSSTSRAADAGDLVGSAASYVRYQLDVHARTVRVAIVDTDTGAIIRQIPSEAMARFAQSWDAYVGKLLDRHT